MWIICGWARLSLPRNGGEYRQERALVMELWHRHSGLKVSVVYRVSDGLNGLNGLNCLNEQRLITERFGSGWSGLGEPRSQSDSGKDRD